MSTYQTYPRSWSVSLQHVNNRNEYQISQSTHIFVPLPSIIKLLQMCDFATGSPAGHSWYLIIQNRALYGHADLNKKNPRFLRFRVKATATSANYYFSSSSSCSFLTGEPLVLQPDSVAQWASRLKPQVLTTVVEGRLSV